MKTFNQNNEAKYRRAKEEVDKLKDFYYHLAIYLVFVPFFIFLNFRSTGFPWAIFPIAGWGIGILGHAIDTFGWNPLFGKSWEEKKIKDFMDKDEMYF